MVYLAALIAAQNGHVGSNGRSGEQWLKEDIKEDALAQPPVVCDSSYTLLFSEQKVRSYQGTWHINVRSEGEILGSLPMLTYCMLTSNSWEAYINC